jgi:hypothetical protein
VTLKTCPNLNPASLFPTEADVLSHSYEEVLAENYTPSSLTRLYQIQILPFLLMGAPTVIMESNRLEQSAQILWAEPFSPNTSAQLAKLIALTKALHLSQGKRINIYTDFKYAFLILHAHTAICMEWGMLTASGSPIKHSQKILKFWMQSSCPN